MDHRGSSCRTSKHEEKRMKETSSGRRLTHLSAMALQWFALLLVAGGSGEAQRQQPPTPTAIAQRTEAAEAPSNRPVYLEALIGSDRFNLETIIVRQFPSPAQRLGVFSLTAAAGNRDKDSLDLVNVTQLNYNLLPGFGPTIGVNLTNAGGLNTSLGFQYVYPGKSLLFVFAPSVVPSGSHDVQNVLVLQYQPIIGRNWRLYTNTRIFSDYVPAQHLNARSFAHFRFGVTKTSVTFGVGTDFDWYSQPSAYRKNFGPFIAYSF